jgi:hypothetical protein
MSYYKNRICEKCNITRKLELTQEYVDSDISLNSIIVTHI